MTKNSYRPLPFWSWNENLHTDETARQAQLMAESGHGGYFMHARSGLETEYMGEEWMENIAAGVECAEKLGLAPWAYDENGWPSGTANGEVCKMGEEYCQKYLCIEEGVGNTPYTLINQYGYHIYYKVNPNYIDTLNPKATQKFVELIYDKYYERFGNRLEGLFTDEPQAKRGGVPWSTELPEAYSREYGESLLPLLPSLFKPIGDFKTIRLRFWKLVTELFAQNYTKVLYDRCEAHNLKLTGHLEYEEGYQYIPTSGAIMPNYEYMHIPGIDCLGRDMVKPATALQVASAAHQLGKKQIISESYGCAGHNVGLAHMKGMFQSQAVRGITLLCQHLAGYSIRGLRKRDHPPALFYQQPWWKDYKIFNDYVAAVGEILGEGEVRYDTLLIHPTSEAWTCYDGTLDYDGNLNPELQRQQKVFRDTLSMLEEKHILFHLGDETLLRKYGHVEGDTLIVGTQRYKTVLLISDEVLFDTTRTLLTAFTGNGGRVCKPCDMQADPILHHSEILHTIRYYGDKAFYYFVNISDREIAEKIGVRGVKFDPVTKERCPFDGTYTFAAYEGIFVEADTSAAESVPDTEKQILSLSGSWKIRDYTPNIYTLDMCDVYFDDKLIEKNTYVLNVQQWAIDRQKPVKITLLYHFKADCVPAELYMLCETPQDYVITINGEAFTDAPDGWYIDTSFKKLNIQPYIKKGNNTVKLEMQFCQHENTYKNAMLAYTSSEIRNKLTYEMEVEPVYLAGDFSLRTDGEFEKVNNEISAYHGGFVLDKPKTEIMLSHLEQQGFPFFAGTVTLEKTFNLDSTDYMAAFDKIGFDVAEILVNGKSVHTFLWAPYKKDLSPYLKKGENTVTLRLTDNLHNMLGPHHCREYLSWGVSPGGFFKESCIWNKNYERPWRSEYCFAERSIKCLITNQQTGGNKHV